MNCTACEVPISEGAAWCRTCGRPQDGWVDMLLGSPKVIGGATICALGPALGVWLAPVVISAQQTTLSFPFSTLQMVGVPLLQWSPAVVSLLGASLARDARHERPGSVLIVTFTASCLAVLPHALSNQEQLHPPILATIPAALLGGLIGRWLCEFLRKTPPFSWGMSLADYFPWPVGFLAAIAWTVFFAWLLGSLILTALIIALAILALVLLAKVFLRDDRKSSQIETPEPDHRALAEQELRSKYIQQFPSDSITEHTDWLGHRHIEHHGRMGSLIGRSTIETDFLGNPVIQHYNSRGDNTGTTRERSDILGNRSLEHDDRRKIVESREKRDWQGDYTEHRDESGRIIGESRKKTRWAGEYIEHKDETGRIVGESQEKTRWAGEYTEHKDETGRVIGESKEKSDWVGDYVEHRDETGKVVSTSRTDRDWQGAHTKTKKE